MSKPLMAIHKTTDDELRNLIFENPKVIVKFTKTNCPVCEKMGRTYLALSEKEKFADIKFLLMDASENPVSSQEVHLSGTPFFAIYRDGVLSQCSLISEPEELEELLNHLS